jgi:hypothetical protein
MAPRMRIAFPALGLVLLSAACGGSSSETPPPLEPDPTSARYTGPRLTNPADDAVPAAAPEPDEDVATGPQKAGRSTWGSGRTAPTPAPALPSMTSPTALPPKAATAGSAAPAGTVPKAAPTSTPQPAPAGAPATNF